jgi:hypothetical protein
MPKEILYESAPLRIGKHEWRVIVQPSSYGRNNVTEYQWRPLPTPGLPEAWRQPEFWRHEEDWPGYNINDGMYLGLPKSLRTLYDREKAALDRHLYGIAPQPDPQASFDFSGPAETPRVRSPSEIAAAARNGGHGREAGQDRTHEHDREIEP